MANSGSSSSDSHRRYEFIEKAYCEARWATVLESGTVLLRELSEAEDPLELAGLAHRLRLLMAHTLLHGYGDRDAAEDLYESVRKSNAEASLRQIAADGLDQCHKPLSSTFVAEEDDEDDNSPAEPGLFLPETENPVLEEAAPPGEEAQAAPVVAVVPAGPPPAEPEPEPEPVDRASLAAPAASHDDDQAADAGLAADPFQLPAGLSPRQTSTSGMPVMPWLASTQAAPDSEAEEEAPPVPGNGNGHVAQPPSLLSLIPEVVEEPELMEVHQASPFLAEEVDLEISPEASWLGGAPEAFAPPAEDDLDDLRSFLLEVRLG